MADSTRSQFLAAGLRLYPQCGFAKLSVRMLAAESGLSPGMFHHVFASKDAFVAEILDLRYSETFGKVRFDFSKTVPPLVQLWQAVEQFARCLRDNLPWVHRIFADSADNIEVANAFLREHFGRVSTGFLSLLQAHDSSNMATQLQRLAYLNGSVFAPLILASRYENMGLFPAHMAGALPEIFTDAAIHERMQWSFSVLFPEGNWQEEGI